MKYAIIHLLLDSSEAQTESSTKASNSDGVDWSDRARPTSHCWLPSKSSGQASEKQCGSCTVLLHSQLPTENSPQTCRPSFVDADEDTSRIVDRHFWTRVPILTEPCAHCQPLGTSLNVFNSKLIRPLTTVIDQTMLMMENLGAQQSESVNDFICLWCSRQYHRSCWEKLTEREKASCDYGMFQ